MTRCAGAGVGRRHGFEGGPGLSRSMRMSSNGCSLLQMRESLCLEVVVVGAKQAGAVLTHKQHLP